MAEERQLTDGINELPLAFDQSCAQSQSYTQITVNGTCTIIASFASQFILVELVKTSCGTRRIGMPVWLKDLELWPLQLKLLLNSHNIESLARNPTSQRIPLRTVKHYTTE